MARSSLSARAIEEDLIPPRRFLARSAEYEYPTSLSRRDARNAGADPSPRRMRHPDGVPEKVEKL
jgi:hypothetical protein